MFYAGQKVECINSGPIFAEQGGWIGDAPVVGNVYTVVDVGYNQYLQIDTLKLLEISYADMWLGHYAALRFRPIVERKTDISCFTDMLKPADERVPA